MENTGLEATLARLEELAKKATPGPWFGPHLGDQDSKCQCASIVDEGYAGGICSVHVGNGLLVGEGGNDAPPPVEAAANGRFITACNPKEILDLISLVRTALSRAREWQPIDWNNKPKGGVLIYWPATTGRNALPPMMKVDHIGMTPNRLPSHWQPLPPAPLRPTDEEKVV